MSHKKDLKKLISEDKILEVINELLSITEKNEQRELYSEISIQSANYHRNDSENRKGTISGDNYTLARNKIINALTYVIDELNKLDSDNREDNKQTPWVENPYGEGEIPSNDKEENIESIISNFEIDSYDILNFKTNAIESQKANEITVLLKKTISQRDIPIYCLIGKKGIGKTSVLHHITKKLNNEKIPILAIKADKKNISDLKAIGQKFQKLADKCELSVFMIDQIETLTPSHRQDTELINEYIKLFKSLQNDKIRIVFSCRESDFRDNTSLSQALDNLEKININEQISHIENWNDLYKKLNSNAPLEELFRTLQIEKKNLPKDINFYKTLGKVYDRLWGAKILLMETTSSLHPKIDAYTIYKTVGDASEKIDKRQKFNVYSRTYYTPEHIHAFNYLCTEGIFEKKGEYFLFFRNDFFDYTFARFFVENENSISKKLQSEHQGLFVRPQIRQILTYLKSYDEDIYVEEVKKLLTEKQTYRFHIRLLVIQHLANETRILKEEKQLFKKTIHKDKEYLYCFTEAIFSDEWVLYLQEEKHLEAFLNKQDSSLYGNCLGFLWRTSPDLMLSILDSLPEYSHKGEIAKRLLSGISNKCRNPLLYYLFEKYSDIFFIDYNAITFFEQHMGNNPDWIKVQILKNKEKLNTDFFFIDFIKKFIKCHEKCEHQYIPYEMCKEFLIWQIQVSPVTFLKNNTPLINDEIYYNYVPQQVFADEKQKIFSLLVTFLQNKIETNKSFVKQEIQSLLSLPYVTSHKIAMELIIANPKKLLEEGEELLFRFDFLPNYISYKSYFHAIDESDYFQYLVKELLKNIFLLLDAKKQTELTNLILSLRFDKSELYQYEREGKRIFVSNYGENIYKLLKMLPPLAIGRNRTLKKRFQELERRFPNQEEHKRPQGISVRVGNTSLKTDVYDKMALDEWEDSMRKYNSPNDFSFGDKPTLSGNASMFQKKVEANPQLFIPLIEKCITDETLHQAYAWAGLKGLETAKYEPNDVKRLFKLYFLHKKEEEINASAIWFIRYFMEKECMDEDLFEFLRKQATESKDTGNGEIKTSHDAAMRYINSTQGAAIENLLKCWKYPDAKSYIMAALESIIRTNDLHSRASAVLYIAFLLNIDKSKTIELFLELSHGYPETVVISASYWSMQYLIYHGFEKLVPYFEKAVEIPSICENITMFLFFAWIKDYPESKRLLDKITKLYPKSREKLMEIACKNLEEKGCEAKCKQIIQDLMQYDEKEVSNQFEFELFLRKEKNGSIHFDKHYDLIFQYVNSTLGKYRQHYFYKALLDNVELHPHKCIELVIPFENNLFTKEYYKGEPLEIVIKAYNELKLLGEEDDELDRALDIFDKMLQLPAYRNLGINVLKEIDIR